MSRRLDGGSSKAAIRQSVHVFTEAPALPVPEKDSVRV
jgi:hypothetical protein